MLHFEGLKQNKNPISLFYTNIFIAENEFFKEIAPMIDFASFNQFLSNALYSCSSNLIGSFFPDRFCTLILLNKSTKHIFLIK